MICAVTAVCILQHCTVSKKLSLWLILLPGFKADFRVTLNCRIIIRSMYLSSVCEEQTYIFFKPCFSAAWFSSVLFWSAHREVSEAVMNHTRKRGLVSGTRYTFQRKLPVWCSEYRFYGHPFLLLRSKESRIQGQCCVPASQVACSQPRRIAMEDGGLLASCSLGVSCCEWFSV